MNASASFRLQLQRHVGNPFRAQPQPQPQLQLQLQRTRRMSSSQQTYRAAKDWSADQYLKFAAERTRPARDLLSRIPQKSPRRVIDLGCGPGNSTAVLAAQYPDARITGIDSSADMIAKARTTLPDIRFEQADLKDYHPSGPVDLMFSNAVFQWVPSSDRVPIIVNLLQTQPRGGVFAFQVPDNFTEPSHVAMRDTADDVDGPWHDTLSRLRPSLDPFQSPRELYDRLKPFCSHVDIWHTYYYHVLENQDAIVEWVKGTGLRPFLDPLSADEREGFLRAYRKRLQLTYPELGDGTVMLRYPRLFVVAVRG